MIIPSSSDIYEARDALQFFTQTPVLLFPEFERLYEPIRQDSQIVFERIKTQYALASGEIKKVFIVATLESLAQKIVSAESLLKHKAVLKKAQFQERDAFIVELESLGYRRDELAEDNGFFSVRGHLIDVFSPYEEFPFRIEFFGDEIVSIRTFDPDNQRSIKELNEIVLLPCRELVCDPKQMSFAREKIKNLGDGLGILRDEREKILTDLAAGQDWQESRWILPAFHGPLTTLFDYLPEKLDVVFIDKDEAEGQFQKNIEDENREFEQLKKLAFGPSDLRADPDSFLPAEHHSLFKEIRPMSGTDSYVYQTLSFETLRPKLLQAQSLLPLAEVLRELDEKGFSIEILYESEKRRLSLSDALNETTSGLSRPVDWRQASAFAGFQSATFKRAFITEQDIFGAKKKRSRVSHSSPEDFLRQFSDLKDGDFVIHEDHGVAKFHNLQKLTIEGTTSEFLYLEFADNDKLYLPIYRLDKIARYVGEGGNPKLDKLGSTSFSKRKARIRSDILKIAHDLLEIAAARKTQTVDRSKPIDKTIYKNFSDRFAYELTVDQDVAVREIEKDLHNAFPMDRLVCGDVGFGKTEVAMRAAMLCLLQGKQVAVLAPTTILVEQHARNFKKRFERFPFVVSHLSRFISSQDQKKIVSAIEAGSADLVIGTHRLLQADIKFKNLGLLIVDEEQRFGVKHKERIKKLRSSIDILTLSATPIPRTLQMAVFGIRELSLITTPPENREAVRTYVGTFDDGLIRNACLKEIQRGGQVLFVHNRVQTIDSVGDRLKKLVPEAKLIVAHGQLPEDDLEKKMFEFIDQRANVLVATTIIEHGLDIPNANTLIVDHSETFGLSDLYQLRGRVGRSHRTAYAHFLIREDTKLTPEASKRLQVIQSCTELGSGFNVATHDLEIRGSGNLLGEEQSGMVAEIGLELYNQMLEETLAEIKKAGPRIPLTELNSGYSAYIPENYIPDVPVRISTYKRLNRVKNFSELLSLEEELLDRFGIYPREVENLCQLLRLRLHAQSLNALVLDCFPGRMVLTLGPNTPIPPEKIIPLLNKSFSIDPKGRLAIQFTSALKKPELALKSKFPTHPEMVDFEICRQFLQQLCEKAGVVTHAV